MSDITKESNSIIQQLTSRITDIKDRLKEDGVTKVAFGELSSRAKTLQDEVNKLLSKKGFYSQADINNAYETMQSDMRAELESESKKSLKRMTTYIVGGIVVLTILYFGIKKMRND